MILCEAVLAQSGGLTSGAPRRFSIAPQAQPFVLTGFSIAVPGGASRLTIDLDSDVPEHDLSLWARFERDVTVSQGNVTGADYFAQTPGSGREQIVISGLSSPPLQTGTYYLAISVATLQTAISGTITATVEGGNTRGTLIISTFDQDTDGWTRNFPASGLPGASPQGDGGTSLSRTGVGGNPGAFLQMTDVASPLGEDHQDYAVAPPKFLGNLGAIPNGRLEFDFQHFAGPAAEHPIRLVIIGNGGAFFWTSGEPPEGGWRRYSVGLNRQFLSPAAGNVSLAEVLSNVERIELSMDLAQSGIQEVNGLDNFTLLGDLPPAPPAALPAPAVPVTSTFDNGTDGWARNYPPVAIPGSSFGDSTSTLAWAVDSGMPGGGLAYSEAGGPAGDFFVAPAKYLGNLAAIPNPRLEFDYRHVASPSGLGAVVVRLVGAGSSYIRRESNPAPFGQWRRYLVPLGQAFFVRESGPASFAAVLAAVVRLEVSADQALEAETNILDNVQLISAASPPVQPVLGLSPASLTFAGVAGEASPTPQVLRITSSGDTGGVATGGPLNWTAAVDGAATWLSLSQTEGITPTDITVRANTAGLAPRLYEATITIAAAGANNTPQIIPVTLNVAPAPATLPRIEAGGAVNAASFRGPLAPGALATLFGANLGGTAEGESAGFLPGQQRLPTIFRGVRVLLREAGAQLAEAPILFLSNRQINFQVPLETAGRSRVQIVVDNNGVESGPEEVVISPAAPGLFTFGANRAVVQNQDYSINQPGNAAARGSIIIAYLTGQGLVSPGVESGQAAPAAPLSTVTGPVAATIGGIAQRVVFFGLAPGFVGLAQANLEVSAGTPTGDQTLLLSAGGQTANGALVSIR